MVRPMLEVITRNRETGKTRFQNKNMSLVSMDLLVVHTWEVEKGLNYQHARHADFSAHNMLIIFKIVVNFFSSFSSNNEKTFQQSGFNRDPDPKQCLPHGDYYYLPLQMQEWGGGDMVVFIFLYTVFLYICKVLGGNLPGDETDYLVPGELPVLESLPRVLLSMVPAYPLQHLRPEQRILVVFFTRFF